MLTSMTGFGKASGTIQNIDLTVELKSVNSRYLEINLNCPKNLNFIEHAARNLLKKTLQRGSIYCYIAAKEAETTGSEFKINHNLLESFLSVFRDVKKASNQTPALQFSDFLSQPDIISLQEEGINEERFSADFLKLLQTALDAILLMQEREGQNTEICLRDRISSISNIMDKILVLQKENVPAHIEMMKQRISELLETAADENSMNQDIIQIADKLDISEEIERFHSHVEQFSAYLDMKESVGKRLNFLLQEMNREVTTMGNKAAHASISMNVVELKNQLEAIREQVQNIK